MIAELVIPDQCTIRGTTERSKFLFVNLLEKGRLIKFDGFFQVFA